ncbi:Hypothetical protein FKW44_021132, partial [Caligus rogercresseyi]
PQHCGNGVLVPPPLVKLQVRNPSNDILCTLGLWVPPAAKMGYWGFKPFANYGLSPLINTFL